jgi:two-component system, LytTR family, response regulator AgrA
MPDVIICEDNDHQRKLIENIVKKELINLKYAFNVDLSTDNPLDVINYVKSNKEKSFIYFLDVDLKNNINGVMLAKSIREYDSKGYIIFITSHAELSFLTFQYKVQALDYIIKSDTSNLKNKIIECLIAASDDYKNMNNDINIKNIIPINLGNKIMNFDLDEILFFETTAVDHKLRIHTNKGQYDFYGKMKDIEINVSSNYYRAHRSYLVNITKIKSIDKSMLTINMTNDEICYVAARYIKGLIKKCLI